MVFPIIPDRLHGCGDDENMFKVPSTEQVDAWQLPGLGTRNSKSQLQPCAQGRHPQAADSTCSSSPMEGWNAGVGRMCSYFLELG